MNMWGEGRAYGYSRFKKSVPTENIGEGNALLLPVPAPAPVLMLLLLSIIATPANKTLLYCADRFRLRLLLPVRPVVGCMLCGNEARYHFEQGATGNSSPFPCYFKISDIKFILTVLYFNLATINTQRVNA